MNMRCRLTAALAALVVVCSVPAFAAPTASDAAPRAQWRGVQLASLFGESDEEKAARLRHEADQDAEISDLKRRLHDLELSLQQATGQNEVLSHRLQQLNDRIDSQKRDFEYKLCTIVAQQVGAGTSADQSGAGLPCDASSALATLATPGGQVQASGSPGDSGGTLGTLSEGEAQSARSQFDQAMNMLAKGQYDEARASFRAFADANPKDSLAPQAIYWVGSIAFVQKDFTAAAQAFAEQIKKYPTSPQGADSMLKLGQSLLALGQKKEGCLTLGAIKSKYKQASASVLSQAATERAASCR
jgi:tol-pal system protein YbgF